MLIVSSAEFCGLGWMEMESCVIPTSAYLD